MPTETEWFTLHADIMQKLNLPCGLMFSDKVSKGRHTTYLDDSCNIVVNPSVDWQRPEHLILHEAAHHRHSEKGTCICWGHCEHWAQTLTAMYHETGYALPEGTQFEEFAKVAGIIHREYKKQEPDAPSTV